MSSSSLSASDPARQRLLGLSKALVSLHKTLLDSERVGYEESFGKIATPAQYLNLVMGDPWFAWLRTLSEFIVQIDETLDARDIPITDSVVTDFLGRARTLLTPVEGGTDFASNYHTAMQRDPDVILAHAGMVKLLAAGKDPKAGE
jgi:hypothetical protein